MDTRRRKRARKTIQWRIIKSFGKRHQRFRIAKTDSLWPRPRSFSVIAQQCALCINWSPLLFPIPQSARWMERHPWAAITRVALIHPLLRESDQGGRQAFEIGQGGIRCSNVSMQAPLQSHACLQHAGRPSNLNLSLPNYTQRPVLPSQPMAFENFHPCASLHL